jgi:hypothetical protein
MNRSALNSLSTEMLDSARFDGFLTLCYIEFLRRNFSPGCSLRDLPTFLTGLNSPQEAI